MTFSLHVDADKFRKYTKSIVSDYAKSHASTVAVIKGNGYGFGRRLLAQEAKKLELNQVAVGSVYELNQALADFAGSVKVLEPFNPADEAAKRVWSKELAHNSDRIFAVLAGDHFAQAAELGIKNVHLEGLTSLSRFGIDQSDMDELIHADRHNITVHGIHLHLPIVPAQIRHIAMLETTKELSERKRSPQVMEVFSWILQIAPHLNKEGKPLHISVSHISAKDVSALHQLAKLFQFDISIDVRLGTSLWLGESKALRATGTVLAIHDGGFDHKAVGYNQVDSHGHKKIVVVSGGTSHGVALAAPANPSTMRKRGIALTEGLYQALGKVRSPFKFKGDNLIFVEPPHMHVSMLWCENESIAVGDEIECTVRQTTAYFDRIVGLD